MTFFPFTLSDFPALAHYYAANRERSCEFCFANNFLWSAHYGNRWAEIEGNLVLRYPGETPTYTLIPGGENPRAAVKALLRQAKAEGVPLQMEVTRAQTEALEEWFPDAFSCEFDADFAEYLYEAESLRQMRGKRLHGKKNFINRFERDHRWSYEAITPDKINECLAMLKRWQTRRGSRRLSESDTALDELDVDRRALLLLEPLGLKGGLLRADGEVVGLSVGEGIGADTFVIHIEKAFSWIPGAYPTLVREFARHTAADCRFLNREEDLGVEGLRRSKLSYAPCAMLEKGVAVFTGTLARDCKKSSAMLY